MLPERGRRAEAGLRRDQLDRQVGALQQPLRLGDPATDQPLQGRRAGLRANLRSFGTVEVGEERVVDDGDVLTAGAPTCGIDLALHLLDRYGGPALADAGARELGYERAAVSATA